MIRWPKLLMLAIPLLIVVGVLRNLQTRPPGARR
jgi:hypothetical protein